MADPLEQSEFIKYHERGCGFAWNTNIFSYEVEQGYEGGTLGWRQVRKLIWDVNKDDRGLLQLLSQIEALLYVFGVEYEHAKHTEGAYGAR